MLEVAGLTVRYGAAEAVRGISLAVGRGEIVCLVGSNGAGKSSSLKGIMGAATAGGSVRLAGRDLSALGTRDRVAAGLALVPEGRHVFAQMTVGENLTVGFRDRDHAAYRQRREAVLETFPRLAERLKQLAGTLSGGEQQMLAIGRALMSGPSALLLDEPTLGLAPVIIERVAEVLLQLRGQGLAVLLAEQNLRMALGVADRGYVIETGSIVREDSAATLLRDPRVIEAYLGTA